MSISLFRRRAALEARHVAEPEPGPESDDGEIGRLGEKDERRHRPELAVAEDVGDAPDHRGEALGHHLFLPLGHEEEDERRYGHGAPGEEIEITALRVTASRSMPRLDGQGDGPQALAEPDGTRSVMFESGWADASVWQRGDLAAGQQVSGPAVIQEATTATVLRDGDVGWVAKQGHLVIELGAEAA